MTDQVPTTAPTPDTPLVGRDREIEWMLETLRSSNRCVTVTGPPGVGKTRLAVHIARRVTDGAVEDLDGVHWIACRDVRSPEQLVRRTAETLELSLEDRTTLEEAVASIGETFADRSELFVFDNLEQTAQSTREVLATWSREASESRFLLTARANLGVDDEQTYRLDPLPDDEAVELYRRGADAVGVDSSQLNDERIAELVERLEGLPLSVELAAAQAQILPPASLLERLDTPLETLQRPDSNGEWEHTLEKSIARSWERLNPTERLGLAQLTVFDNGVALEPAEGILELDRTGPELSVPQLFHNLDRKSLVRRRNSDDPETRRFVIYMPVREFVESLRPRLLSESDLERRHAEYYAQWAEELLERFDSQLTDLPLDRLGRESANLFRAFEWALEHRPEWAAIIGELFRRLDRYRPLLTDRVDFFERIVESLEYTDRDLPPIYEVRMTFRLLQAKFFRREGVSTEILDAFRSTAERADRCGDDLAALWARETIAWIYKIQGAFERAREVYLEALQRARRVDDPSEMVTIFQFLATINARLECFEDAHCAYRQAEKRLDSLTKDSKVGRFYAARGIFALSIGRVGEAAEAFERSYRRYQRIDQTQGLAFGRINRGLVRLLQGQKAAALEDATAATEMIRDLDLTLRLPGFLLDRAIVHVGCDELDEAVECLDEAEHTARRADVTDDLHQIYGWQAIATARRGETARAESRIERAREVGEAGPLFRVARAEQLVTDAEKALDSGELREANDLLGRAARTGLPDQECDEPFYIGSEYGFLATRLFEHRLRQIRDDQTDALLDADKWLAIETHRARWFQIARDECVDLSSRGALRRVLALLVERRLESGTRRADFETLIEHGWPDEEPESVPRSRVYQTVSELRNQGLDGILLKDDEGYYLDPEWPLLLRQSPV